MRSDSADKIKTEKKVKLDFDSCIIDRLGMIHSIQKINPIRASTSSLDLQKKI